MYATTIGDNQSSTMRAPGGFRSMQDWGNSFTPDQIDDIKDVLGLRQKLKLRSILNEENPGNITVLAATFVSSLDSDQRTALRAIILPVQQQGFAQLTGVLI